MTDLYFLKLALEEARKAYSLGEVPVGAVVVKNGKVVGRGFNSKELLQDPTAHAEVVALREAARNLNSWRLNDCTLYSTVEPCVMCCGAIIQARVGRVVYSVPDPKFGGVESLFRLLTDERNNHRPQVEKLELPEVRELMRSFFRQLRRK